MTIYPTLSNAFTPELYHKWGFETDTIIMIGGIEFNVNKTKEQLSDIMDAISKYGKPDAFKITEKKPKWANPYCVVEVSDINAIESIIQ